MVVINKFFTNYKNCIFSKITRVQCQGSWWQRKKEGRKYETTGT